VKAGPNFHSEHNLFPIGYISIRTYSSMFKKGTKAEYTCEILDGGDKPIYRVTSSEDPDNPIEKVAGVHTGQFDGLLGVHLQEGERHV
jgi:hypothetical protein